MVKATAGQRRSVVSISDTRNKSCVAFNYEMGKWMKKKLNIFLQVNNEQELIEAIEIATGEKKDCLCFIEVVVHKDDTSKELLEWGSRVSSANSRAPNPQ